jgi:hypothetical protein
MSIVRLEAESVIYHIVEGMLPRFSDSKLGLMINVDMQIADHGYGADGNTRERKELNVRMAVHFLFRRSSNYTKVLSWQPKKDAKGLDMFPVYAKEPLDWHLMSDHDSCWRDAVGSHLTDMYFAACGKFEDRKISGKPLRPVDLFQFVTFWSDPKYVRLDVFEQKNKAAERFSDEGRAWLVRFHELTFAALEAVESPNAQHMCNSGLLVKGSEDHQQYLRNVKTVNAV